MVERTERAENVKPVKGLLCVHNTANNQSNALACVHTFYESSKINPFHGFVAQLTMADFEENAAVAGYNDEGDWVAGTFVSSDKSVATIMDYDGDEEQLPLVEVVSDTAGARLSRGVMTVYEKVVDARDTAMTYGKPVVHYGWIPFIIYVGMNTDPKPTWSALLNPN